MIIFEILKLHYRYVHFIKSTIFELAFIKINEFDDLKTMFSNILSNLIIGSSPFIPVFPWYNSYFYLTDDIIFD